MFLRITPNKRSNKTYVLKEDRRTDLRMKVAETYLTGSIRDISSIKAALLR